MGEANIDNRSEVVIRPRMLKVLCILTFIWSGCIILLSIAGVVFTDSLIGVGKQFFPKLAEISLNLHLLMIIGCLILLVFSAASILGSVLMWRMRKAGFVIYTIANGLVLLSQIFLKISLASVGFALISLVFILLYARCYKTMK